MSSNIRLTDTVKDRLEEYKEERGHSNYDSAVREIMLRAGVDIYDGEGAEEDNSVWDLKDG